MAENVQVLDSGDLRPVDNTCKLYKLSMDSFFLLREAAFEAKGKAYCPYSNFRVGAAILGEGSEIKINITTGANVENASYPVGTCAERVAFSKAVTEGRRKFHALAVATDISPPASPCGMCRQFIREFCDLEMPIFMFDKDKKYVALQLKDLLPMSFGPEHLGKPPSSAAAAAAAGGSPSTSSNRV